MKTSKLTIQDNQKPQISISVRNLVEFLLRSGDIDDRHGSHDKLEAMQEGSRIHRKIQRRMGGDYHPEVPLKYVVSYEEYDVGIEGRADGIAYEEDEDGGISKAMIDEIKGIYQDVYDMKEPVPVHLAQAKCYAYIFASQQSLPDIRVQMTYCNLDTQDIRRFSEEHTFEDLEGWFGCLMEDYRRWADFQYRWRMTRNHSVEDLAFPYEYREGQRNLVRDVYRSIFREKLLFVQAPTGTGKTIGTIYPAVQAVGNGLGEKIFYLTAKTSTGLVARNAFGLLAERGYRGKTVVITARDKMCLCEQRQCNPQDCPYAKGHFDRINDAVFDLLQQRDMMDREALREWARDRMVCPFELSLDAALWADHIICDYNYVFDPNVYLKRFFAEGGGRDYIYLMDEAHNLVDRAREMYSESLCKEDFLAIKRLLKPFGKKVEHALERCNKLMLGWKRECGKYLLLEEMDAFLFALMNLAGILDELIQKDVIAEHREELLEFYFRVRNFLNLSEGLDEHYRLYCDFGEDMRFYLHLFCIDPSLLLQQRLDRGRAGVFFSATLLPVQYYKELLCARQDVYAVYATSVFAREKLGLFIASDVTSRYVRRTQEEYAKFAEYISRIVSRKRGNYMVFCPSYRMMEDICRIFTETFGSEADVMVQASGMKEEEREDFLQEFSGERDRSLVAFCVLGGIFAEGIDLRHDRLIGAVIVGAGLPQLGNEREIMKSYFEETGRDGFAYAYLYPGMNKVIQAAGRVIRTTEDVGVVALLDERFLYGMYRQTFPREWEGYQVCTLNDVGQKVGEFWEAAEGRSQNPDEAAENVGEAAENVGEAAAKAP